MLLSLIREMNPNRIRVYRSCRRSIFLAGDTRTAWRPWRGV